MKTLFQLAIFMTLTVVCNVGYCQPDSTSDAPLQKTPTDQASESTDDQASDSAEDKPQVEKSVKPGINKKYTNPKSTLASIKRALKPDGYMIIIDFERIPGKTRKFTMRHVRAGKAVFRGEIQNAGFKLVDDKWIKGFKENYFLKFKHN